MAELRVAKVVVVLFLFLSAGVAALAAQPVITQVTIPNESMKIGDVVTATITVQSDSATTYTLSASTIGGYTLGGLAKSNSTTYTAQFTITESGNDYTADQDIPTNVTLADGSLTDTWTAPISQDSDPIDANRPAKPATPDLAAASDKGESSSDDITNDDTPTFQGAAGAVEGSSTVTVTSSLDGGLGTTVANADGSWSFTSPALSDGYHDITVTATDAAGNESVSSDALAVLIDTQPPDAPGGRNPADGTYTNDPSPTLSWAVPNDPGGSGVYEYRVQINGPVTRDHYTTSTSYAPSLGTEGTYTWRLYAIDVAGNDSAWTSDWTFTIDVTSPTVTAVTPSTAMIAEADVGAGAFSITVDYNEPMDTSVDPTISFPAEDPSATITFDHGAWTDDDTYVAYYNVVDADQELADVDIQASGGQDLAGNVQDPKDSPDSFSIDTVAPEVVSITSGSPDGYYNVGDTIDVTVAFSEPVTLTGGTLDIDLDSGVTVSITSFGPNEAASVTYTVAAGENSCDLDATGIALNGGTLRDNAGNDATIALPGTTIADGSDITVDTTDPVISDLVVLDETVGDTCEATVTFSATVTDNCCVNSDDVTVNVSLPSGNATLGTPTITKTQNGNGEVDVTGSVQVSDLNGCPATVEVTIDATDCCGNNSSDSQTGDVIDTTAPVISDLVVSDETVDDTCEATVTFSATVTDNCCVNSDDVTVNVSLPSGNATLGTPTITKTQNGNGEVDVTGSVQVSDLNGCPATVEVAVDATDCCGNAATQASSTGNVNDTIVPTISWTTPLPASPQYVNSGCSITIPIDATVSDNCCISAANVAKTITVTNASVSDAVAITQVDVNHVKVAGNITVSALTGCPAVLTVAIGGTDCCGKANHWTSSVEIYDHTIPTISNLVVADHVLVSPDCCETLVPFTFDVTDACCIGPSGITITSTNPTENATIDFDQAQDVVFTQIGQGHVAAAGVVRVRCVTSCPARVEIYVEATDCCGNAGTATSTETEGRVYDMTQPIAVDDPSGAGDTSAVLDPNMDVRLDDYGQYRLMVRQDTPVRIDVLGNDTDNCSLCTCCATMWINDIVQQPQYGTLSIETDHGDCHGGTVIRYAPDRGYVGPDQFTYRIVDACGNVSNEATVYVEVVAQTKMEDVYTTTCAGEPVDFSLSATDLWIDRDSPARVPFAFSMTSSPMHGIIMGDLNDVTYSEHGRTTKQIEAAAINLTYVPASGFTGRDSAKISFSDPFGGESETTVDITTGQCAETHARVIEIYQGDVLPILVPHTFSSAYEAGEIEWSVEGSDGSAHSAAISARKSAVTGTYTLSLDTKGLPPGEYKVTLPLGSGEQVEFTVEVSE